MTPTRAEEIAKELADELWTHGSRSHLNPNQVKMLSEAITQAIEEQRNRDHMPDGPCGVTVNRAVAQERSDCAEIAEEHNGCVDVECLSESNCGASIAAAIRGRK
jgi:hypothetical protein